MAGIMPQQSERLVHADPRSLGDHALDLRQDDPGVERHLELLRNLLPLADETLAQDADGGHVGHGLGHSLARAGQAAGLAGEQAERAEALVAQAHRHGVGRGEAGAEGGRGEVRPACHGPCEVVLADRLTAAPAVQAGAVLALHPISSMRCMRSLEEASARNCPWESASTTPASATPSTDTHRSVSRRRNSMGS